MNFFFSAANKLAFLMDWNRLGQKFVSFLTLTPGNTFQYIYIFIYLDLENLRIHNR